MYFFFCFCHLLRAQHPGADSLFIPANPVKGDTAKIRLLNDLSKKYRIGGNYDSALKCSDRALQYAKLLNDTARKTLNSIAGTYVSRGILFKDLGNYPEALQNAFKALKNYSASGSKRGMANVYNLMGNVYFMQNNASDALKNFTAAFELRKSTGDSAGLAVAYNNLGIVYDKQSRYDEAIVNYEASLQLKEALGDKQGLADTYNNIANAYRSKGNLSTALKIQLRALEIRKELKNKNGIAISYLNISDLYNKQDDYSKAEAYCLKALELAKETGNLNTLKGVYENCAAVYGNLGKHREALAYYKLFVEARDSLYNEENTRKIIQLQLQYDFDKKEAAARAEQEKKEAVFSQEKQISELKLSRSIYFSIGLSVLVLVIAALAFLLVRQNRIRSGQRALQLEQKLLRSQMNPHFIFNSLIAIESFIYKNEAREAGKYLSGFARLMRLILENSREEYIPLGKEIKTLEHYLELQKLRFEEKFSYSIETEEGLDPESVAIPPMLAQPFIENSIEHGLLNLKVKGQISIRFFRKGNELVFEVRDNGIGPEKAQALRQEEKRHQSLATVITEERLAILNKIKSQKIKVSISELKDAEGKVSGTEVSFSVPLEEI